MQKLRFLYEMRLNFSQPIQKQYFSLRCLPKNTVRQKLYNHKLLVEPCDGFLLQNDGLGNCVCFGRSMDWHDSFLFSSSGVVWIDDCKYETDYKLLYTCCSPYTKMNRELTEWSQHLSLPEDRLKKAEQIMHEVNGLLTYKSGSTDIYTTAVQAFLQREGVCQDYAHIMLALCRYQGIPARYAAGLILGEGYTHAWVEVYIDGRWQGMDPTNDCYADNTYIKLADGRDYGDCLVDRGIFCGNAVQQQSVYVNVEVIR